MLSELIVEYNSTQQEIKRLEEVKKKLKVQIDLKLSIMGESKYEDTHYSAVMSSSQRVKYDSEGLMSVLLSKGYTQVELCTPKLDLKKLESLVANGNLDPEIIADYAVVKDIKTLTVKEKK